MEVKRKIIQTILLLTFCFKLNAQEVERLIQSGNTYYRAQQYTQAETEYRKALELEPGHRIAAYNLANTVYRNGKDDAALGKLDTLLQSETDNSVRARTYYNSGSIVSRQYESAKKANQKTAKAEPMTPNEEKLLLKSIEAYKNSLRIEPGDQQARENLQKALLELKKRQPKKDDQQKKKQEQKQKQQQQPQMNRKEAEQRLKLLEQKEKEVQERLQKEKSKTGGSQAKDW